MGKGKVDLVTNGHAWLSEWLPLCFMIGNRLHYCLSSSSLFISFSSFEQGLINNLSFSPLLAIEAFPKTNQKLKENQQLLKLTILGCQLAINRRSVAPDLSLSSFNWQTVFTSPWIGNFFFATEFCQPNTFLHFNDEAKQKILLYFKAFEMVVQIQ